VPIAGIRKFAYANNRIHVYRDNTSEEVVAVRAPFVFDDHFFHGAAASVSDYWSSHDQSATGTPNLGTPLSFPTGAATRPSGWAYLIGTATSQAEDGALYTTLNMARFNRPGLLYMRFMVITLPASTQGTYLGLVQTSTVVDTTASPDVATIDEADQKFAGIRIASTGAVTIRTDDDTTDSGYIDTGVTLTASTSLVHDLLMTWTDYRNIKFRLDDVDLNPRRLMPMTDGVGATDGYSPIFGYYKFSGTTAPSLRMDRVIVALANAS